MRKRVRILLCVTAAALLLALLSGCADLKKESEVRLGLQLLFPFVRFRGVESDVDDNGYGTKVYSFTCNGIDFTVTNRRSTGDWGPYTSLGTDYYDAVIECLSGGIAALNEEYAAEGLELRLYSGGGLSLTANFIVSDYSAIASVPGAAEALADLLKPYLPRHSERLFSSPTLGVQIYAASAHDTGLALCRAYLPLYKGADLSVPDGTTDVAAYYYLWYGTQGKLEPDGATEEQLSSLPPLTLTETFVDGKALDTSEYAENHSSFRYVWSVEDGCYCAPVIFGVDIDYNGGVQDYVQKDILAMAHPDASYTIDGEKGTSTWTVCGDVWKAVLTSSEDGEGDTLTFYRNGRRQNIEAVSALNCGMSVNGATYMLFVPLSDYAEMLGLRVENIDTGSGAVYFTSK